MPEPGQKPAKTPDASDEPKPPTDATVAPPKVPDADDEAPEADDDRGSKPTPDHPSRPPTSDGDHPQNTLPARLHSRGISIPDDDEAIPTETDGEALPEEQATDEPPVPAPSPRRGLPIEAPSLIEAPKPESPEAFPNLRQDSRIVLTNDGFGVAPALNKRLSAEGCRVRIESRRPELSAPADTVVFLGSLRAPSDLDDAMSVVDDAVHTAEKMTTRLMQPDSAFVAVIDTGGTFGLGDFEPVTAPFGALVGLVELLRQRHPGATTKLIDVDGGKLSGEAIADLVADELLEGGDQTPIGIRQETRQTTGWNHFETPGRPAKWLDEQTPPLVYMPGSDGVLSTAVERLAIAHELPIAILRRRHTPDAIAASFDDLGIDVRSVDYDLNRLFETMDFLDGVRSDYGPIAGIVAESLPAKDPEELAGWDVMRPPLDEFNALLAMTINDPLRLLGVGIGPNTPPIISSALRYFARAESLRRKAQLDVRLAHLPDHPPRSRSDIDPRDFALTEFLASSEPAMGEIRLTDSPDHRR